MDGRVGCGRRRSRGGSGRGNGGRWVPRPAPLNHHPQQPVSGSSSGSVSNEEGRITCSEDDDNKKSGSGRGTSCGSNNHHVQSESEPECHPPVPELHFDICRTKQTATVVLKPPLLVTNRERRNQIQRIPQEPVLLRPGMVLLKAHISLQDQVMIVKRCRDLGVGCGGFYQPGYEEGTKLHLKMMCLGKNWDPLSSQYGECRPCDGAKPPDIPPQFHQLVQKAIASSHSISNSNAQHSIPPISPDICIVNFYSQNGRLGLHQDKDESKQSLRQGLPVVSFSIGDSAEFLYGDDRDVDKAQKVVLESGDVLIFGGKSRNIFHGVTAIHPMTAPSTLLHQTNLLSPGRLNLTFRQY